MVVREQLRIESKRRLVLVFLVTTILAQIFFISMIAERTFMIRDVGGEVTNNLEEVRNEIFDISLRTQSSKIKTIRETWRSMHGMVGDIGDDGVREFLFNVVSIVEGVDSGKEILVIERDTGNILFPFDRSGENLSEMVVDDAMLRMVMSSRDIIYPNYFVGKGGVDGIPGEILPREARRFGEGERVFYSKVLIPRPRTGDREFIVLAGFREDRVVSSYQEYSYMLEDQIKTITDASHRSLVLVAVSMIVVIILGFVVVYSIKFILWDMAKWERKKDRYEECYEECVKDLGGDTVDE